MNGIAHRPVPDYVDLYAGTDGSIVHGEKGELIQRAGPKGYLYVSIPGIRGTVESHRLIAAAYLGRRPAKLETRHNQGGKRGLLSDNAPTNLCYGSHRDNMQDAIRDGRHAAVHNLAKTKCPKGHRYTPENTYTPPGTNKRVCRKCKSDNDKRRQCQ